MWAEAIRSSRRLQKLAFVSTLPSGKPFGVAAAEELVAAVVVGGSLRSVSLGSTARRYFVVGQGITGEEARCISKRLNEAPALTQLSLAKNRIADYGAASLADAIKTCPQLLDLDLSPILSNNRSGRLQQHLCIRGKAARGSNRDRAEHAEPGPEQ